jgi:hypothetical protein
LGFKLENNFSEDNMDTVKRIKFFIEVNGYPVRSLEELEDNFHIQDVLELHRAGILSRWLAAHRFENYEKMVDDLKTIPIASEPDLLTDIETAEKLMAMFCPQLPDTFRQGELQYLRYLTGRAAKLESLKKTEQDVGEVINTYHSGYEALKSAIQRDYLDMNSLALSARMLVKHCWKLVELDVENFCTTMLDTAPGIFFPLLGLGKFRDENAKTIRDKIIRHIMKRVNMGSKDDRQLLLTDILQGENSPVREKEVRCNAAGLMVLDKSTQESWEDIVPETSSKIMIVYLPNGNFVRSRSDPDRKSLSVQDVNWCFPVLDGLDYKGLHKEYENAPLIYYDITNLLKEEAGGLS